MGGIPGRDLVMVSGHCVWIVWALLISGIGSTACAAERDDPVGPVPFTEVTRTGAFRAARIETNRTATIVMLSEGRAAKACCIR